MHFCFYNFNHIPKTSCIYERNFFMWLLVLTHLVADVGTVGRLTWGLFSAYTAYTATFSRSYYFSFCQVSIKIFFVNIESAFWFFHFFSFFISAKITFKENKELINRVKYHSFWLKVNLTKEMNKNPKIKKRILPVFPHILLEN